MNEDRILEMFFEKARWQYAIEKGLFKDMNKAVMYQLTKDVRGQFSEGT